VAAMWVYSASSTSLVLVLLTCHAPGEDLSLFPSSHQEATFGITTSWRILLAVLAQNTNANACKCCAYIQSRSATKVYMVILSHGTTDPSPSPSQPSYTTKATIPD
jgi:hypothetical protein